MVPPRLATSDDASGIFLPNEFLDKIHKVPVWIGRLALFDSVDSGTELEEPEDSGSDTAQDGHEEGGA